MQKVTPGFLFLPGLLCDDTVWAGQVNQCPLERCHVADYGDADSIETMAQRALEKAPQRFVLVGHSMGGRVALEIYRRAPERVSHLILMDTGFRARSPGEQGQREEQGRMALLEKAYAQGMRAMGETWTPGMIAPQRLNDHDLVNAILDMIERKTPAQFEAQIKALLNRPEAAPLLEHIRCPTLLLCGRLDSWSPLARHEEMAALIPESELVVIEDAGHMAPMEQPEQVASAMYRWLEALS